MTQQPSLAYLSFFRFIIAGRTLIFLIALPVSRYYDIPASRFTSIGAIGYGVVLAYLLIATPRTFGRLFMAIPIISTTILLLMEQFSNRDFVLNNIFSNVLGLETTLRIQAGAISYFLALTVLLAWVYPWRVTLWYCIGLWVTLMVLYFIWATPSPILLIADLWSGTIRVTSYGVVGFVVTLLIRNQVKQQKSLQQAHDQLSLYAATLEQLSISRERNRLAHELHDTLAHTISATTVKLNAINIIWDSKPLKAKTMLQEVIASLNVGMTEIRRALRDLRASPLEDMGLLLALRQLIETSAQRGGWELDLRMPQSFEKLRTQDEQAIYRIVQEALENIIRHADAKQVGVSVTLNDPYYYFTIKDDGCGFDQTQEVTPGHYGLSGMRQRALILHGMFRITSQPQQGTTLEFSVEKQP
jgi:signal transduction histidine kinase